MKFIYVFLMSLVLSGADVFHDFFFQNNASKLLLAIMESRGDSENAERILYNMSPKQLVSTLVHC